MRKARVKHFTRSKARQSALQKSEGLPFDPKYQHIRLLKLLQGEVKDEICCQLSTHSLESLDEEYEALSYTWAPEAPLETIILGGQKTQIRPNLYSALLHLRYSSADRYLWVDALCIDQQNDQERGTQIRQMYHVFRLAKRVIAWIGPEENNANFALERIISFPSIDECVMRLDGLTEGYEQALGLDGAFVRALSSLDSRSYWTRGWVVQELSQESVYVMNGDRLYPLELVRQGLEAIFSVSVSVLSDPESDIHGARSMWNMLGASNVMKPLHKNTVLRLVNNGQTFNFHDERDKIYAYLSMPSLEDASQFQVDYQRDYAQTQIDFAKWHVSHTGQLDILSYTRDSHRNSTVPSWVPNWNQDFIPMDNLITKPHRYKHSATSFSKAATTQDVDSSLLRAHGLTFDVVKATGDPFAPYFKPGDTHEEVIMAWERIFMAVEPHTTPYDAQPFDKSRSSDYRFMTQLSQVKSYRTTPTSASGFYLVEGVEPTMSSPIYIEFRYPDWELWRLNRTQAFICTITCYHIYKVTSMDHETLGKDETDGLCWPLRNTDYCNFVAESWVDYWSWRYPDLVAAADLVLKDSVVKNSARFFGINAAKTCVGGGRIFITEKGYIGIGGEETDIGDKVILVEGGPVPILCREAAGDNERDGKKLYEAKGECYVHGIMDGEAWGKGEDLEEFLFC